MPPSLKALQAIQKHHNLQLTSHNESLVLHCNIHLWPVDGRAHLHSIAHCPFRNLISWQVQLCPLEEKEVPPTTPPPRCRMLDHSLSVLVELSGGVKSEQTGGRERERDLCRRKWAIVYHDPLMSSIPWQPKFLPVIRVHISFLFVCVFCVCICTQLFVCYIVYMIEIIFLLSGFPQLP